MHNDDPRPLSAELAQILSMVELPNQRLEAIEVARSLPRRFTVQEAAIAAGISMATMYRVIAADGITVIGRRDPRGQVQPVQGASHRTVCSAGGTVDLVWLVIVRLNYWADIPFSAEA